MQCPVGDRHHLKRFPVVFEGIVVMKIRVASEHVLCSVHHQRRIPYLPESGGVTYQTMQLVRRLNPYRMSDKALLRIVPVCMSGWVDVRLLGLLFRHQDVTSVCFFCSLMLALNPPHRTVPMHKHQFQGHKTRTKLCEFPPCQLCFWRIVLAIYAVAAVVEWCINMFWPQFKRNVAKEWRYARRRLEHGHHLGVVAGEHPLGGN